MHCHYLGPPVNIKMFIAINITPEISSTQNNIVRYGCTKTLGWIKKQVLVDNNEIIDKVMK